MQQMLLRTRDETQKKLMRAFIEQNVQGTVLVNDDELAERTGLERSEYLKAIRTLDTKDIIKYYPLPTSRAYAKSFSLRLVGERRPVVKLHLPIDKLALRFEHIQQKLKAATGYATNWQCRSKQLLEYFGEHGESCGVCDVCSAKR